MGHTTSVDREADQWIIVDTKVEKDKVERNRGSMEPFNVVDEQPMCWRNSALVVAEGSGGRIVSVQIVHC